MQKAKVLILIIISILLSIQVFAESSQQEEYIRRQYQDITDSTFNKFVEDSETMFPQLIEYMNHRKITINNYNFLLVTLCFSMFIILITINKLRVIRHEKRINDFNNLPSLDT